MTAISGIVIFRAQPGEGDKLVERLPHAASLVADAPGCQQSLSIGIKPILTWCG